MPLDLNRIQALCFDIDGTLSDTDDQFVQKVSRWLKPIRFIFPGRDPRPFSRWLILGTETPANFMLGFLDWLSVDDEIAKIGDYIYRLGLGHSHSPFSLVPGVSAMLEKLKGRYPLSVVSARGQRTTQIFIDQFNLGHYFQCMATAQTCHHTKPYPDPILWAARQIGVAPERCLMIGDTTVDMRAGKAAGAQTVGVLCGFGTAQELWDSGADAVLPSTADLLDLLKLA